jgi:hypothetical protein
MNWKVILSCLVIASAVLMTGCQFLYDCWPADISPLAVQYIGLEPNSVKWYDKNLHTAKELKNQVVDTYIGEQLKLDYLANLNREKYQQVLGILDLSIRQAQADRQTAIGTIEQPGWLLAGLLTLLPVGSYVAGWRTLWPSHYTEQEVQTALRQAQDKEIAKAKSQNA